MINVQAGVWNYTGPYGFGDMDMLGISVRSLIIYLEVGNGLLTLPEERTHFNLWALSKSPLLIGTNVFCPSF
jgi:alpha-galactosidase